MRSLVWAVALIGAPLQAAQSQDYELGVAARRSGEPRRAIELLERVARKDPRNADAQLQLGLAYLDDGRVHEAESAFRNTLAIAPDYWDARIGLARVHQRRGDRSAALAELRHVPSTNAEAAELRSTLTRSSPADDRSRLDIDASYSSLGSGQKDWRDLSVRFGRLVQPATELAGLVEASKRFGRKDVYAEAQVHHRISPAAHVWIALGGTPKADFRPEWQIAAGGGLKLRDGVAATVATLEARHARFEQGGVQTIAPGIEQYLPGGHWVTARMINTFDENGDHRLGWLARADVVAGPRVRIFGGAADAPDVSEGIVTDTFSLFGGAVFDVGRRTQLRLSISREDRENGTDRLQAGVGLGLRF